MLFYVNTQIYSIILLENQVFTPDLLVGKLSILDIDIDLDFFNSEKDFVKYRDIIINLTKGTDIITITREHSYFNFLRDNIEWTNDIALQKILNLLEVI